MLCGSAGHDQVWEVFIDHCGADRLTNIKDIAAVVAKVKSNGSKEEGVRLSG